MGNLNRPTLVLLHGHAGSPVTFRAVSSQIEPAHLSLPISPDFSGVRSWWTHEDFGPSVETIKGLALPPGPIVIGGFSQGAAMAASVAARNESVVGLITVAGFLCDPAPELVRPLPLLSLHSEDDETVDPFLGARLERWAQSAGGVVSRSRYEGGHVWTEAVDKIVIEWFLHLCEGFEGGEH